MDAIDISSFGYGWITVLPTILTIGMAVIFRRMIIALNIGIISALIIIVMRKPEIHSLGILSQSFEVVKQVVTMFFALLWGSVSDPWNLGLIISVLLLGGFIGLISSSGSIERAFSMPLKYAHTSRSSSVLTALYGLMLFFDDYINTIAIGSAMSSITGKLRVSKAKLAYIVDATAAPMATVAVLTTWTVFYIGQISGAIEPYNLGIQPFQLYLMSIPAIFYAFVTFALMFFSLLMSRDMGMMHRVEVEARETGVLHPKSTNKQHGESMNINLLDGPRRGINFFIPLGVFMVTTIAYMFYTGGYGEVGAFEAFINSDVSKAMVAGAFVASIATVVFYLAQRLGSVPTITTTYAKGVKSVSIGVFILVFAWTLGGAIAELELSQYLVSTLGGSLPVMLLPIITFILAAVISISTGTSFGSIAILMPIVANLAIPLATMDGVADIGMITLIFGSLFAGAIFGDHSSPISDTTIMSSIFSSCDVIVHVKTQIPYAMLAAMGTIVGYLLVGFGVPLFVALLGGIAVTLAMFMILSKPVPVFDSSKK